MPPVTADFAEVFATLKQIFRPHLSRLSVQTNTSTEYILTGRSSSPFPQHKGRPMYFGAVRIGKSYVSFHLMPLYMDKALTGTISPALKKRMQGKTCFNFKSAPEAALLDEFGRLTREGVESWVIKKWL
jgi:hypothetical protein